MAEKDFPGTFAELRATLKPYAPEVEVIADTDVEFGSNTHWRRPKDGYPGYFGSMSCFNITAVDAELFGQLEVLTWRGYEKFAANGLLDNADG